MTCRVSKCVEAVGYSFYLYNVLRSLINKPDFGKFSLFLSPLQQLWFIFPFKPVEKYLSYFSKLWIGRYKAIIFLLFHYWKLSDKYFQYRYICAKTSPPLPSISSGLGLRKCKGRKKSKSQHMMRSCSKSDVCKQRLRIKYMPEANFFNSDTD